MKILLKNDAKDNGKRYFSLIKNVYFAASKINEIMKKIIFVIAFLFVAVSGFSQESKTDLKAKAVKLVEMTSGSQFEMMLKPLVDMIPEQNQAAFKAEVKESLKDFYDQVAGIYMESFTEEDIDAILAFYHTPVGERMLEKLPEITQKSMTLGQQWGMKIQPIMAKYSN